MHQNWFPLGLRPRPCWGSLQHSPRPSSCLSLMESLDPPLVKTQSKLVLSTINHSVADYLEPNLLNLWRTYVQSLLPARVCRTGNIHSRSSSSSRVTARDHAPVRTVNVAFSCQIWPVIPTSLPTVVCCWYEFAASCVSDCHQWPAQWKNIQHVVQIYTVVQ